MALALKKSEIVDAAGFFAKRSSIFNPFSLTLQNFYFENENSLWHIGKTFH